MTDRKDRDDEDGRRRRPWLLGLSFGALLVAGAGATRAGAAEKRWTVEIEPVFMAVYGHDRHVMTRRDVDAGGERATSVHLETDTNLDYRGRVERAGPRRSWGLGFFWARASQAAPTLVAAGGPGRVDFEVADRAFVSESPDRTLFFQTLEDTVVEIWTLDLYARQPLLERDDAELGLELGLRLGDFDNDYRAVVGVTNVGGRRLDASSNYDRLMGPRVGLVAAWRRGRHTVETGLGQALLLGTADKLTSRWREFDGPFGEAPAYVAEGGFERRDEEVAIPITELRLRWSRTLGQRFAVGAGVETAVWWNVPVPPGVVPSAGVEAFDESTLVLFGVGVTVAYRF